MTQTTQHRVHFDSTTLAGAIYDDRRAQLQLDFRSGARYIYSDVPPALFLGLLSATSKGTFFNRHIRGRFRYAKIQP